MLKHFKEKPVTLCYPYEKASPVKGMRAKVTWDIEKCIGCSLCERICPGNAIKMFGKGRSAEIRYFITRCIYCGECVDVCPTDTIRTTTEFELVFTTPDEMIIDFKRSRVKPTGSKSKENREIGGK